MGASAPRAHARRVCRASRSWVYAMHNRNNRASVHTHSPRHLKGGCAARAIAPARKHGESLGQREIGFTKSATAPTKLVRSSTTHAKH